LSAALRRLQVQNVADIMFSGAFGEDHAQGVATVCDFLDQWIELNKHPLVWLPYFEELPLPAIAAFERQAVEVNRVLHGAITRAREDPESTSGMLAALVQGKGAQLSDLEVRKNLLTFLAAGSQAAPHGPLTLPLTRTLPQDAGNGLVHVVHALAAHPEASP
jgi:cytochrome P450